MLIARPLMTLIVSLPVSVATKPSDQLRRRHARRQVLEDSGIVSR
jgi:hypothetical protein